MARSPEVPGSFIPFARSRMERIKVLTSSSRPVNLAVSTCCAADALGVR
ncbi:hypothetical protein DSL72_005445 [Monilinia vaccinii-corymbosi]|uniref:Uncharacterized protein n=1 Tax=Monilinia vaccinii-corymbosi TaxID=61207 RepID=A0A8A3PF63_9HELO|nr:hypothetical protein DSL72_005445 [Monilinia vaccinii-corymbosi]